MTPSATAALVTPLSKVEVSRHPEKHVHGAEDKTPLEAISHGPLLHPGMINYSGLKLRQRVVVNSCQIRTWPTKKGGYLSLYLDPL
jgi:hypothetical protein